MSVGVGALGQQGAGFIPNDPGVSEGKLRVGAQRHSLLLAKPLVAEMPGFAPAWRYSQRESIKIREGVFLASGFCFANAEVGHCHVPVPELGSGTRC